MSRKNTNLCNEMSVLECYADDLSDISSDNDCNSITDSEDSVYDGDYLHNFEDCGRNSDSDDDEIIVRKRKTMTLNISSSESEQSENEDIWIKKDRTINLEAFEGNSGAKILPEDVQSIPQCAALFLDNDFFTMMAEQTNIYYEQNKDKYKPQCKTLKFQHVTCTELKKFIGLIVLMGQNFKSDLKEYWSTDPLIETPIFSKVMSRAKFEQILRFWHFQNNSLKGPNVNRLYKIENVVNHFIKKFNNVYTPQQEISLDEGMIPWRGKLCFRTYNPMKPTKYGILVRMVCESKTGYISNFEIYTASGKKLEETIMSVMTPCLNVWHHLYQDNFYNSVKNTKLLLQNKVRVCGTMRLSRGLPPCLRAEMKHLKKGDMIFRRKGDILCQVWRDKRDVKMISSIHNAEMLDTNKKTKHGEKIVKPKCIIEYNKYMKGVDRADQYLSYFGILRKTRKWTKRVVLFLMNCALFNAYIVYRHFNPSKKITYKLFLREVSRDYITSINERNNNAVVIHQTKRPSKKDPPGRLSGDINTHILKAIPCLGKKKFPTRACRVCATHKKRSETRYICNFCAVPLHKGNCFQRYHTLRNY